MYRMRGEMGEIAWSHQSCSSSTEDGKAVDDRSTGTGRLDSSEIGFAVHFACHAYGKLKKLSDSM